MKYSVCMSVLLREDSHRQIVLDTIASVKRNSGNDYELIICDDGSSLMTGWLRDEADFYIRHKKSIGISSSWNDLLSISRSEYIIVINDDIQVPPPLKGKIWLDVLSDIFGFSDCGVCGPRVAGPKTEPKIVEDTYIVSEKFFPGYCFMLKRDRFFEKFDEQFSPFNFEDTDYWWRIMKKGLKLYRAPIQIWHGEGMVLHKMDYEGMSKVNKERFIKKHGFDPIPYFYGDADLSNIINK